MGKGVATLLAAILLSGCASSGFYQMADAWCDAHPGASPAHCTAGTPLPKTESWDQENLKKNDKGCPTAVYVAPGGNLEQCQTIIGIELAPHPVSYKKYDTAEEAATVALRQIADQHGGVYEWGGMIGKTADGKYEFSEPSTDYEGARVELRSEDLPPDAVPFAGYHTHPCLPNHEVEFFSPPDLLAVIFGHEPAAFMGDFCTGRVHEYKYGDAPADQETHGIWLTKGRIVGQFTAPHAMAGL